MIATMFWYPASPVHLPIPANTTDRISSTAYAASFQNSSNTFQNPPRPKVLQQNSPSWVSHSDSTAAVVLALTGGAAPVATAAATVAALLGAPLATVVTLVVTARLP